MSYYDIRIEYPSREGVDKAVSKFGQIRHLHNQIDQKVLGHTTNSEGWILFDDMLASEYSRLQTLLTLLDQRVG